MEIFTMGSSQKSAKQFFELISKHKIEIVVDVRLNNSSQLAGFSKGKDLAYFLKEICNCDYDHSLACAPTKDLMQLYKKDEISSEDFEAQFTALMIKRNTADEFKDKYSSYSNALLLCSEPTIDHCHRRIVAEYLEKELGYKVIHI